MRRILVFALLIVVAGCSPEREKPAAALSHATALRDSGEFKKAAALLGNALDAPNLSASERKDLQFQLDLLRRLKLDYSMTRDELFEEISASMPDLTTTEFNQWLSQGRFDGRKIDGKMKYVNTSLSNLYFRYPELRQRRADDHDDVPEQKGRLLIARAIKKAAQEEKTPFVLPHYFLCTMTVAVKENAVPTDRRDGKLIRAWLPIPRDYPYQNQFKLIRSSTPAVKVAPETSLIRSAYFEQHSAHDSSTAFRMTYSYMRSGVYFDMDPAKVTAPDLYDPVLKKYTSESPHVLFTDKIKALVANITGDETNPLLAAKSIYDWIGTNIQYSYAREYSTLTNISDYCLSNCYGDCGQESLLFITLCRCKGIPARWQSGWDLFPGFHDIHDWSEIYIAPYGWVPVDPWAGLYSARYCTSLTAAQRRELHDFYFGGLDFYRMAANGDHSQTLDPPKDTLRSDNVDFQRGELETSQRNLYFDKYSYHMDVDEFGCAPFTAADFKDFATLEDKLAHQSDPISAFLWRRLSAEDQSVLLKHLQPGPNLKKTQNDIVDALNGIVEIGGPDIFEPERFAGIMLRPETAELEKKKLSALETSRFNRLLLEDAFPTELSRNDEPK